MNVLERTMPSDENAEKSVLGAVLLDPTLWAEVDAAQPHYFHYQRNREIFEAMAFTAELGEPIDANSLRRAFLAAGLEFDPSYVAALIEFVPPLDSVAQYLDKLRELYILRQGARQAQELMNLCLEPGVELDRVRRGVTRFNTLLDSASAGELVPIGDLTVQYMDDLEARRAADEDPGVPTKFMVLNSYLGGGFEKGDLVIIAARPNGGKTSLMLNLIEDQADLGFSVGVFSLEMTTASLLTRLNASRTGVDGRRIRFAKGLSASEVGRVDQSMKEFATRRIYIDDTGGLTMAEIASRARKLHRTHGLDILYIDYLQLIRVVNSRYRQRHLEVGEITKDLKALAKDLGIPIVLLCQLSRGAEEGERPQLKHLKEAGAIEEDSDIVLFPHRPENLEFHKSGVVSDLEYAELILAKGRNVPKGIIKMTFAGKTTRFYEA